MADKIATNTFDKGLNLDLNPIVAPSNVLSNCLNGTFLTFNGQDYTLQNDMGNAAITYNVENKEPQEVSLQDGYVPTGITSFGGILYIVSHNPLTNKSQVGSFPSTLSKVDTSEQNFTITEEDLKSLFKGELVVKELLDKNTNEKLIFSPYDQIKLELPDFLKNLGNNLQYTIKFNYKDSLKINDTYVNNDNVYCNAQLELKIANNIIPSLQWEYASDNIFITYKYNLSNSNIQFEFGNPIIKQKIGSVQKNLNKINILNEDWLYTSLKDFYTGASNDNINQPLLVNTSYKVKFNYEGSEYIINVDNLEYEIFDRVEIFKSKNNSYITYNFKYDDKYNITWELVKVLNSNKQVLQQTTELKLITNYTKKSLPGYNNYLLEYKYSNSEYHIRAVNINEIIIKNYYTLYNKFDFFCVPKLIDPRLSSSVITQSYTFNDGKIFDAIYDNKKSKQIDANLQATINYNIDINYTNDYYKLDDKSEITLEFNTEAETEIITEEIHELPFNIEYLDKDIETDLLLGHYEYENEICKAFTLSIGASSHNFKSDNTSNKQLGLFKLPLNKYGTYMNEVSYGEYVYTKEDKRDTTETKRAPLYNINTVTYEELYSIVSNSATLISYNSVKEQINKFIRNSFIDSNKQFYWIGNPFYRTGEFQEPNNLKDGAFVGRFFQTCIGIKMYKGIDKEQYWGHGQLNNYNEQDLSYSIFETSIGQIHSNNFPSYGPVTVSQDNVKISGYKSDYNNNTNIIGFIIWKISDNDFIIISCKDEYFREQYNLDNLTYKNNIDYNNIMKEFLYPIFGNIYHSKYLDPELNKIQIQKFNIKVTNDIIIEKDYTNKNIQKYQNIINKTINNTLDTNDRLYDFIFCPRNSPGVLTNIIISKENITNRANSLLQNIYSNIENKIQPIIWNDTINIISILDCDNKKINLNNIYYKDKHDNYHVSTKLYSSVIKNENKISPLIPTKLTKSMILTSYGRQSEDSHIELNSIQFDSINQEDLIQE